MRKWPLIVYVPKRATRKDPDPVKVLHVSRENGSGLGSARTECGRELAYTSSVAFPEENFLNAGDDLTVDPDYGFRGRFKMCRRCGSGEDFAMATREYVEGQRAAKEMADRMLEAKAESVSRMQCAIRATLIATCLPEGSSDVTSDGWGIKFRHDGKPLVLKPTDEECERLRRAAEEATCTSE